MPKKGLTAVKVTFMTMTLVTLVTAVKFDSDTVQYSTILYVFLVFIDGQTAPQQQRVYPVGFQELHSLVQ